MQETYDVRRNRIAAQARAESEAALRERDGDRAHIEHSGLSRRARNVLLNMDCDDIGRAVRGISAHGAELTFLRRPNCGRTVWKELYGFAEGWRARYRAEATPIGVCL